jgi:hypothetical protein
MSNKRQKRKLVKEEFASNGYFSDDNDFKDPIWKPKKKQTLQKR